MTKETTQAIEKLVKLLVSWQPIYSAPRNGTHILVMNNNQPGCENGVADECWGGNTAVAAWWGDGRGGGSWVCFRNSPLDPELHFTPTHWQELPAPPQPTRDPVLTEALCLLRELHSWDLQELPDHMSRECDSGQTGGCIVHRTQAFLARYGGKR